MRPVVVIFPQPRQGRLCSLSAACLPAWCPQVTRRARHGGKTVTDDDEDLSAIGAETVCAAMHLNRRQCRRNGPSNTLMFYLAANGSITWHAETIAGHVATSDPSTAVPAPAGGNPRSSAHRTMGQAAPRRMEHAALGASCS